MSGKICVVPLITILIIFGLFASSKQVLADNECGINVSSIKTQCLKFVQKSGPLEQPSQGCCTALKAIDVTCTCKLITDDIVKKLGDQISKEKAVFVAKSCGIKIPAGAKCPSF